MSISNLGHSSLSSSSRNRNPLTKRVKKHWESYIDKPPETIILKIPEMTDSPDMGKVFLWRLLKIISFRWSRLYSK